MSSSQVQQTCNHHLVFNHTDASSLPLLLLPPLHPVVRQHSLTHCLHGAQYLELLHLLQELTWQLSISDRFRAVHWNRLAEEACERGGVVVALGGVGRVLREDKYLGRKWLFPTSCLLPTTQGDWKCPNIFQSGEMLCCSMPTIKICEVCLMKFTEINVYIYIYTERGRERVRERERESLCVCFRDRGRESEKLRNWERRSAIYSKTER